MASIGAGVAAKTGIFPSSSIKLYTFGQPRTGNGDYAVAHAKQVEIITRRVLYGVLLQVPETYRVVHAHDLVPHVPLLGFEGYKHHKS